MSLQKSKIANGMMWRFLERFLATCTSFIISVVLARLITPEEYGSVALTMVFINIANVFVSDSVGKALIQKKDIEDKDYSSVLWFNIFISLICYTILYISAPCIGKLYKSEIIVPTLRVIGLKLPIAALNSLQHSYVSKKMLFKRFFWSTTIGTVCSGIVGITCAYMGFGIWSLVAQYLTNAIMDTLILWFTIEWKPQFHFDYKRTKDVLKFGFTILSSGLINAFYDNMRSVIIGTKYSTSDLAFYNKGIICPNMIITNVNTTMGTVLYPAFAEKQDNREALKVLLRKAIKTSTFLIFPMLLGMYMCANEFTTVLLTEKWSGSVPYLRLACIYLAFYPINTALIQVILGLGKGKEYVKVNSLKKIIGMGLILISLPFGVYYIVASEILLGTIALIINLQTVTGLINYTFQDIYNDVKSTILVSLIMGVVVYYHGIVIEGIVGVGVILLFSKAFVGAIIYVLLSYYLNKSVFVSLLREISMKKIRNQ